MQTLRMKLLVSSNWWSMKCTATPTTIRIIPGSVNHLLLHVLSGRYKDSLRERLEALAGQLEAVRKRQLLEDLEDEVDVLARRALYLSSEGDGLTELVEAIREGSEVKSSVYLKVEQALSDIGKQQQQVFEEIRSEARNNSSE